MRATYLTQSGIRLLHDWGAHLSRLFPAETAYLVGSALTRADYRDVDVRLMLDDHAIDLLSSVMNLADLNLAVSLWGQQVTGLPIDFQVQRMTDANAEYDGRRQPLGRLAEPGVPVGGGEPQPTTNTDNDRGKCDSISPLGRSCVLTAGHQIRHCGPFESPIAGTKHRERWGEGEDAWPADPRSAGGAVEQVGPLTVRTAPDGSKYVVASKQVTVRSAGGGDQPDTEWVPWHDAIGRRLVSGDLIAQVRRMAAVQHPGPYDLYVEMWSQGHECWCRPILDADGRVEVMRQPECAKCGDDATVPCECTPEARRGVGPGDQPDTPCPHCKGLRRVYENDPDAPPGPVPCPACTDKETPHGP